MSLTLTSAATDVIRDQHAVLDPVTGIYRTSTLLEMARTNTITRSEPTVAQLTDSTHATDDAAIGSLARSVRIQSDGATAALARQSVLVAPVVGEKYALSVFVVMEDGDAPAIGASTSAGDFVFVFHGNNHFALSPALPTVQNLGGGLYRCSVTVTATNTTTTSFGVMQHATQSLRAALLSGFQVEQGAFATSYMATAGAAYTRPADNAYYNGSAFAADHPVRLPQESWFYTQFIEGGTSLVAGGATPARVWNVGAASTADPRLMLYATGTDYVLLHRNGVVAPSTSTVAIPSMGQLAELLAVLFDDGSFQLHARYDGTPVVSGTKQGPYTLQAAWADDLLCLNSIGSTGAGRNAFLPNGNGELVTVGRGLPGGSAATPEEAMDYAESRWAYIAPE